MAWPSTTANDVLSGKGAKTLGVDFWDRDAIAAAGAWTWGGLDANFSADTSWATQYSAFFRLPEWAEATAVITVYFLAKQSGGSDNADFRLRGRVYGGSYSTGGTTSDPLTGSFAQYSVTLAVPASPSWTGEVCEFLLDAQHTTAGGTWTMTLYGMVSNMKVVPISP